ncbi:MAG: hypothetical protein MO852_05435 [Candidatus Devosia euplotis]|nr:hypothetical protein [Candidatus Devosia euplotis]
MLYRSESGETVYAIQGDADLITAIRTGIVFSDHGNHADIDVEDPALAGAEITGDYPVHFVEHDGHWTAFFDNEGLARVFDEHEALEGHVDFREVKSAAPHHGVVVPYGDFDLVSESHPEDPSNLPIGIKTLDRDGNAVGDVAECPDLHGEAASGNQLAFACATGLLVVTLGQGGAPDFEFVAYSETLLRLKLRHSWAGVDCSTSLGTMALTQSSSLIPARMNLSA